jgi:hypothetical protein
MNQDFLNEISAACKEDTRLREILRRILSMDKSEMEAFKKKNEYLFHWPGFGGRTEVKAFFSVFA